MRRGSFERSGGSVRLRERRKKVALKLRAEGKTQEEAASAVGVAQKTLSKWEEGNNIPGYNISPPDLRLKIAPCDHKEIHERVSDGDSQAQVAASDSVKKCATLLGVGLELYTKAADGGPVGNSHRNGGTDDLTDAQRTLRERKRRVA